MKSINPYNSQTLGEYPEWGPAEIDNAIKRSERSFESWKNLEFPARAELMRNASGVLKSEKGRLAELITLEMGKPVRESEAEILKCAWVCDYYAENAGSFLSKEVIETDASKSYVVYEPLGPVLAVMPWNFPFWQVFRFAAPNLMAGNTALLKHASNVQGCAREIENVFKEAGFPEFVFQNIPVSSKQVDEMINHSGVKAVTLTGSENAGIAVAVEASRQIKKSVLELGGSNAFIVFKDADLDLAVETATKARMMNTGQSCIAAKRFFVHKDVAGTFIDRIIDSVRSLKKGDPLDPGTEIGPLSSTEQAEEVERQIRQSVKMGAEIKTGGSRTGCFIEPAVLTGMRKGMPVMDEEVFGPVLSVAVFEDENEAIDLANASSFGLGATLFSNDIERAEQLASGIEDGAVFINELVKSDPRLPFGGTKRSGYGRELSRHGILEFVNIKTIYIK